MLWLLLICVDFVDLCWVVLFVVFFYRVLWISFVVCWFVLICSRVLLISVFNIGWVVLTFVFSSMNHASCLIRPYSCFEPGHYCHGLFVSDSCFVQVGWCLNYRRLRQCHFWCWLIVGEVSCLGHYSYDQQSSLLSSICRFVIYTGAALQLLRVIPRAIGSTRRCNIVLRFPILANWTLVAPLSLHMTGLPLLAVSLLPRADLVLLQRIAGGL